MTHIVLTMDGEVALREPVEFSALGEASVRLGGGGIVTNHVSSISCSLVDEAGAALLHVVVSPPSDDVDAGSEWLSMPGARHDRVTLAVDSPGFTVCFDAVASTSSSRSRFRRSTPVQAACTAICQLSAV